MMGLVGWKQQRQLSDHIPDGKNREQFKPSAGLGGLNTTGNTSRDVLQPHRNEEFWSDTVKVISHLTPSSFLLGSKEVQG